MRRHAAARLCRLTVTGLAVTGLLGHGLAMLLVTVLAANPAPAGEQPPYGKICAADGSATAARPIREDGDGPPRPGKSHRDACPVCTAFAHGGLGALPTPAALPWMDAGRAAWTSARDAATPAGGRLAAHSRGPPTPA